MTSLVGRNTMLTLVASGSLNAEGSKAMVMASKLATTGSPFAVNRHDFAPLPVDSDIFVYWSVDWGSLSDDTEMACVAARAISSHKAEGMLYNWPWVSARPRRPSLHFVGPLWAQSGWQPFARNSQGDALQQQGLGSHGQLVAIHVRFLYGCVGSASELNLQYVTI